MSGATRTWTARELDLLVQITAECANPEDLIDEARAVVYKARAHVADAKRSQEDA